MIMSRLLGVAFACSISLISISSFAVPPSDDGRCDVLLGSTPGLFGLCMAYWATQENANGQGSSKILDKYVEKYDPEVDPYMPGLVCPCWTPDELALWEANASPDGWFTIDDPIQGGWFDFDGGYVVNVYSDITNICEARAPGIVDRSEPLNQLQFEVCLSEAKDSQTRLGLF